MDLMSIVGGEGAPAVDGEFAVLETGLSAVRVRGELAGGGAA